MAKKEGFTLEEHINTGRDLATYGEVVQDYGGNLPSIWP